MSEEQKPLNALPRGHRLQEYELMRVLGFDDFGMTYQGFDHNLDKAVVIKEYLPSDITTRTGDYSVAPQATDFRDDFQWGLYRFLEEARTLARFDHRHIIKVYRFFEAHGTAYMVMEYAEGETLSTFLARKGTLSEAELKAILYPILDGLQVVHRADFLHLAIEPANIIIRDEDDSPVLLNFGTARQAFGTKSRSVTSVVTSGYAPIEQYSSQEDQGPWTDIYALGGVCYWALTAQVPDDAIERMRDDSLIPVTERCTGQANQEFLWGINKALQVDKGDRPQSIMEWRVELGDDSMKLQELMDDDSASRIRVYERSEKLLKQGSEVNAKSNAGWTPLHIAAGTDAPEKVEALLDQGAEVNVKDNEGRTPLHIAALADAPEKVEALLDQGAEVNVKDNADRTPLHYAAFANARETVKSLIDQGANVNAKDNEGETPLHVAATKNASETAEVLLKQGAYANAKANGGWTPLHGAALHNASKTTELLLRQGADVNTKSDGDLTPLHVAATKNASETAEVLLKQGAYANAKATEVGWTPLHWATVANAQQTAEILLRQGADVNTKNNFGLTPLHIAAGENISEMTELLLNRGANVNAKTMIFFGDTPLGIAKEHNAYETAEILRRYGGRK